jgi:hypothetical protein
MIEGSLRNVPLTDVFQVVVTGQKSGILTAIQSSNRARIYFELGKIQYAHIAPGVHLGEILVRKEFISAHEAQEILFRQSEENPGTPFGITAVALGLLSDKDLHKALAHQVHEVLLELLTWKKGQFSFEERSHAASQVPLEHSLDAMSILMDAAQNLEEWREGSVAPENIFQRAGDPTKVEMPVSGWEVLSHIDGKRSARTIAAELDISERRVYRIMYELEQLGVLEELPFKLEAPLILVISESITLQSLLRLTLLRAGLKIKVLPSIEQGMKALPKLRPSDGEGWDFVKGLRKLPGQGHLPVVVLSTEEPQRGFFGRFFKPRANTLRKPFYELELQETVSKLIGRSLT